MKKPTPQLHKQKSEGKKKHYKVRNWKEYNAALVNRGRILFWITEEATQDWVEKQRTGKRGKPKVFSTTAIQTALTIQQVFHMPLRQTAGFLTSIFDTINLTLPTPDYTTLGKRTKSLAVTIRVRPIRNQSPCGRDRRV